MSFSERNRQRCEAPNGFNHPLNSWTLSDWMTATMGELGEAANIVKKMNRHRDGIKESTSLKVLRQQLADELADAEIYMDLLFQAAGIDREKAIAEKFQKTSDKIGYRESVCMDGDGRVSHDFAVHGKIAKCRRCGQFTDVYGNPV